MGEALSQHQQTFLADDTNEVARVARHVLSILAKGGARAPANSADRHSLPASRHIDTLTKRLFSACIQGDPTSFASALSEVQSSGQLDDVLAYEMIPSVARQLGTAWVDDTISFADVTVGCARLQSALRQLPDNPPTDAVPYNGLRRRCLVAVPKGAQHTLGALVLAKQLRQVRQHVVVELEAERSTLSRLADQQDFDVVLISVSSGECPNATGGLVQACREHWRASKIAIGGSMVAGKDVVDDMGADHVTQVWQEALNLCN